jgi:hypothetical protein
LQHFGLGNLIQGTPRKAAQTGISGTYLIEARHQQDNSEARPGMAALVLNPKRFLSAALLGQEG